MSKLLANEIANYGDDAPIDLKEGLNIPAGKPIQAAGVSGSSGMVLTSTGSSIAWTIPFDGNYNTLTNKPSIPAAQVNSDWNATSGVSVILNKPTVPPLTSLTVNPAGTPALSFNAANGEFTYTPPDLSNYDTAFGWGDHAQAGYLTTETSTFSQILDRSKSTLAYYGSYANLVTANTGSTNVHFENMVQFSNDVQFDGGNDRWSWGSYAGAQTWCGSGGDPLGNGPNDSITNWGNRQFELIHWDANRPFDASIGYGISGALYLKSLQGGTISIGSDTGTIQLGSNDGTVKYLEASSTATKLFHNGSEKLTTTITGIDLGSSELVTTGKLVYSNNYANVADLPSATTYHGMFAHVHAEGHGYMSHGGVWLQLIDETSSVDELSDVNTAAKQDGYVLKWDSATSNWKPAPDLVGTSNAGITLQDLSVQTGTASSTPSLSYSNTTGVFTYTPPDLSGFLTSYTETDPVFSASAASGILSSNIANWDSAYGWGDHASAGYLTAESDTLQSVVTRGGTVTSGTPAFETNTFFIGTGTGAGNGGKPYILWDNTNNDLMFSDDTKITLGYNGDLNIYHFTTLSGPGANYISAANNTELVVSSDVVNLMNQNHSGWYFKGEAAGSVVYHNNTPRLTTTGTGVTVSGALTAGGLTYPTSNGTSGDVLTSDGAGNVTWQTPTGGGGGANVTISDTIPAGTPNAGDLWWESDSGRLKVYYQDTDSAQWVDASPPLASSGGGGGGIALADLSVQSATASGGGSLAYNNITGVFTHTPPDLSNSTNWDTAYGWGDHASAGYLTSANTTFTGLSDTPGSYTAGAFIATNSSGNALVSSNLYQNGNGVGIGQSNPQSILHLYQPSDAVYMTFESSSTIPYWMGIPGGAVGNGGFWIERGDNNNRLFSADTNDYVSLWGAGTQRLETTSTGVTVTGSITAGGLTYPTVNGTNGDVLTSDGTGGVAWQTPSAGGSGSLQLVTSAVLPSDVIEVRYDSNLLQQDTVYRMVGILEVTGNAYGGFNMNPSFYDTSTNTQYGQAFSGQQNTQYSSPANHESICGPFTPVPTSNQFGLQNAVWYDEQGSLSWWLRTDQQNNIAITGMYFEATFSTYLGPWMHMTFGSMNNRYHTGTFTGGWNLNPLSTYINNMEYSFVGGGQQIKAGSKIWLYKYV